MLNRRFAINFLTIFLLALFNLPLAFAANTSPTASATTASAPTSPSTATPLTAGQVIVTSGSFSDMGVDKKIRTLKRGDVFYNGDTLITADKSKAQVRFTDGTVVALEEKTNYKILDYHYQEPGIKDKNFTSLLTGGFRALTGVISKHDPSAYQVSTSVAAIGVRGTMYGAVIKAGKLFVGVWKGKIVIANDAGTILLGTGATYDYAMINSLKSSPVGLLSEPSELAGQCQQVGR